MEAPVLDAESRYRNCLQALVCEMETAMQAIASNDLLNFADSVARQEVLASSLQGHWPRLSREADCLLDEQTASEQQLLQRTNRTFASLLKHTGRTNAMLASLCSMHTGSIQEVRGSRSKHQTWSCEM